MKIKVDVGDLLRITGRLQMVRSVDFHHRTIYVGNPGKLYTFEELGYETL